MAVLRSDLVIPEIFTPYIIEETTKRDAFLASGVVEPMAELNATEGGDYINIPFYTANLDGDFERLTENDSLTPGKINALQQRGVIVHRGRAFETRDLAALGSGTDPMAVIGTKLASYIANQRQKDLLSCLDGVFGEFVADNSGAAFEQLTIDAGTTNSILGPRQVSEARSLLGDQGSKLTTIAMHSSVYYDLQERRALDYVYDDKGVADSNATSGSTANAFGTVGVEQFMGLNVIVSDDLPTDISGSDYRSAVYFFTQGAIASGEQLGLRTETDRDILAKSTAMSIDLHYCYHPIGAKWQGDNPTIVNPTRTELETKTNWIKVYENNNIGIVRATVKSNFKDNNS